MKVSYFPGCTLKNKAKDLDIWARRSAEALGITLEEINTAIDNSTLTWQQKLTLKQVFAAANESGRR